MFFWAFVASVFPAGRKDAPLIFLLTYNLDFLLTYCAFWASVVPAGRKGAPVTFFD